MLQTTNIRQKAWYLSPILIGAGLSLAFHFVFLAARIPVWRQLDVSDISEKNPIEIVEAPPEYRQVPPPTSAEEARKKAAVAKAKALEIAETEDAKNRKLDPNAKFLSDKTQTAEEQMRAKAVDDFRTKQGTGAKGQKTAEQALPPTGEAAGEGENAPSPTEEGVGLENAKTPGGTKAVGVKRNWKTLSIKDLGVEGDGGTTAASDDRLEDVRSGARTILSTREFRYFAYYHRIKELLRQYWKPNVERQLTRIWSHGRSVSDDEMVTKVMVLLDPTGAIQKISRVGSSGITELDDAAVEAFEKAGPFPNPPKGMLDDDGFVRIHWDFILKTESGPRIQFRNVGAAPPP